MVGHTTLAQAYTTPTYTTPIYTTPTYTTPTYTTPIYTTPSYYYSNSTNSAACVKLSQNLYRGLGDTSTAGAVGTLQKFLASQGYFTSSITGYFGPVTFVATQIFQASQGIQATGYVGLLTRAAIQRVSCGISSPAAAPEIKYLLPASGQIGDTILLTGSGFLADNAIYFDNYPLVRVASQDGTTLSFVVPLSFSSTRVKLGQHSVFVQNANGSSNTRSLTITTNSVLQRPAIQSVTKPATLYAGKVGTWVVSLSVVPSYTNTIYISARWGDENLTTFSSNSTYSRNSTIRGSTATLTHTYAFSGTYQVSVTLSDYTGQVLSSEIFIVSVY